MWLLLTLACGSFSALADLGSFTDYKPNPMGWKIERVLGPNQKTEVPVHFLESQVKGLPLIFITLPSSPKVKQTETVQLRKLKNRPFLFLSSSQGQFEFDEAGRAAEAYQLKSAAPFFGISKSCKPLKLKIEMKGAETSRFPAILSCRYSQGILQDIVFSSTADAQWFGSSVLETAGKGERWKTFAPKDFVTAKGLELSWGSDDQKSSVHITAPTPTTKSSDLLLPPFAFHVGLSYLSGKATGSSSSGNLSGILIPLRVDYLPETKWYFLTAAYDFFAVSFSKSAGIASQTNQLMVGAGGKANFGNVQLTAQLDYINENLQFPQEGANFTAPQLGLGLKIQRANSDFGALVKQAQTGGSGTFTETDFEAFYEQVLLFDRQTRFTITDTQLKATTTVDTINASWITFGAGVTF